MQQDKKKSPHNQGIETGKNAYKQGDTKPYDLSKYARERIERDGLPPSLFRVAKDAIEILYNTAQGEPIEYPTHSKALNRANARRSMLAADSKEALERSSWKPYTRLRYAPKLARQKGHKYTSPAGISPYPFFTLQVQSSTAAQRLPLILTEGEITAQVAATYYRDEAHVIGFAGNTVYRVCEYVEQALRKLKPSRIVINFDADAIRARRQGESRAKYTTRRLGFIKSAIRVLEQLKRMYNEKLPAVYISIGTHDAGGKGLDDVILKRKSCTMLDSLGANTLYFLSARLYDASNVLDFFNSKQAGAGQQLSEYACIVSNYAVIDDVKLETGKYLHDAIQDKYKHLDSLGSCIIQAGTGLGKTTAATLAAKSGSPRLIIAPYLSIVEQQGDALQVTADKERRAKLLDALSDGQTPALIVCTYASFRWAAGQLEKHNLLQEYILTIDEAHNFALSASAGYMLSDLLYIADRVHLFKSVQAFTATPLPIYHKAFRALPMYKFSADDNVPVKAFRVGYSKDKKTATVATLARDFSEQAGEDEAVAVFLNSKGAALDKFQEITQGKYITFNATTKDTETHKAVVEREILPQFAVCTSVFREGVSIRKFDTEKQVKRFHVLIGSNVHPAEIIQFLARLRTRNNAHIEGVSLYYFGRSEQLENSYTDTSSSDRIASIEAQNLAAHKQGFQVLDVSADMLSLSHKVVQKEKCFYGANLLALEAYLGRFGIECTHPANADFYPANAAVLTSEQQERIEERKETKKELKERARIDFFERLNEAPLSAVQTCQRLCLEAGTTEYDTAIEKLAKGFLSCHKAGKQIFNVSELLELYEQQETNSQRKAMLYRLEVATALKDEKLNSKAKKPIVRYAYWLKKILHNRQGVQPAELREAIQQIASDDVARAYFNVKELLTEKRNSKLLAHLRGFFEIEAGRLRDDTGKRLKTYSFSFLHE